MKNNRNPKPAAPSAFDEKAVARQLRNNWFKTALGIGLLSALTGGVLYAFGLHYSWIGVILGLFGVVLPIFSWYNSAALVKKLMRCERPNPNNENHMRLVRLVDELYPLTGLKKKPEVMVSPIALPNAFATGRNPSQAFIAATQGLFSCDLSDAEIKAVLAHELAHVKSHDVAITSLTSVLSSLFAIVLSTGFPRFFHSAFIGQDKDLLDKLSNKVKNNKKGFAAPAVGLAGFIITLLLFWLVSFCAKFVTLFVSRSRESAADVLATQWTGDPCALSTALQKIVAWTRRHEAALRLRMILDGMSPLLFISLDECKHELHSHEAHDGKSKPTARARLRKWWEEIGANHPPMDQRLAMLNVLAGQTCPLLSEVRRKKEEDFDALIKRKYGKLRGGRRPWPIDDDREDTDI
ncbi:MAG: M48 family metalloprotease [Cyanobacteria bacterium REEB67]|nr:M48 family metalloprotease [Cyanobacteria bacterium REEB67]